MLIRACMLNRSNTVVSNRGRIHKLANNKFDTALLILCVCLTIHCFFQSVMVLNLKERKTMLNPSVYEVSVIHT